MKQLFGEKVHLVDKALAKFSSKEVIGQRRYYDYDIFIKEIKSEKTGNEVTRFLLSIDDTSLKPLGWMTSDNGGSQDGIVQQSISRLIDLDFKPTIFFVPNPQYSYLSDVSRSTKRKFDIDELPGHQLISFLKMFERKGNLEIALHGYCHLNPTLKGYHSFEFDGCSAEIMESKLMRGFCSLTKHFSIDGFKPPAWSIGNLKNTQNEFFCALSNTNLFNYVSLSSPSNGMNYYDKKVSHIHKSKIQGFTNIPQNLSIILSLDQLKQSIDLIADRGGIINLQLHSQKSFKFLTDGFCSKTLKKLELVRKYIDEQNIKTDLSKTLVR